MLAWQVSMVSRLQCSDISYQIWALDTGGGGGGVPCHMSILRCPRYLQLCTFHSGQKQLNQQSTSANPPLLTLQGNLIFDQKKYPYKQFIITNVTVLRIDYCDARQFCSALLKLGYLL